LNAGFGIGKGWDRSWREDGFGRFDGWRKSF